MTSGGTVTGHLPVTSRLVSQPKSPFAPAACWHSARLGPAHAETCQVPDEPSNVEVVRPSDCQLATDAARTIGASATTVAAIVARAASTTPENFSFIRV